MEAINKCAWSSHFPFDLLKTSSVACRMGSQPSKERLRIHVDYRDNQRLFEGVNERSVH
jgi:hypothetical protein